MAGKIIYLLKRFEEPSTWASITAVLALIGYHLDGQVIKTIVDFLTLGTGIAGIFVSEYKPEAKND